MTMKLSDEQLMAYVDGDPSAGAGVIAEKARSGFSAEESRAMDDFHRTRDLVREAFAEEDREPLPADLVALVLGRQDAGDRAGAHGVPHGGEQANTPARVIPLLRETKRSKSLSRIAMALAASIGLAFVIVTKWQVGDQGSEIAAGLVVGPVASGSILSTTLEGRYSGDPVALDTPAAGPHRHLVVVGTFRDRNARICREVELLDEALVPRLAAVACRRSSAGIWNIEGTAAIALSDEGGATTFAPASTPEKDVLDALMSMLGASSALSPAEERALIDNAWK